MNIFIFILLETYKKEPPNLLQDKVLDIKTFVFNLIYI